MGIKQIALMVAAVVIIGFVVLLLTQGTIIQDALKTIWDAIWGFLEKILNSGS